MGITLRSGGWVVVAISLLTLTESGRGQNVKPKQPPAKQARPAKVQGKQPTRATPQRAVVATNNRPAAVAVTPTSFQPGGFMPVSTFRYNFNKPINPYGQFYNPSVLLFNMPNGGFNSPFGQGFNNPFGQGFNNPFGQGFNNPFGQGFNNPFGQGFNNPFGQGFNNPFGYGNQFGNRFGNPFGNPFGFPIAVANPNFGMGNGFGMGGGQFGLAGNPFGFNNPLGGLGGFGAMPVGFGFPGIQ